ncbi:MAG: DUF1285 domain-containing protein [Methyloceanibacter sp.]
MPGREKTQPEQENILVALAVLRGKPGAIGPAENCGDIGLKIGRDGTWYYQGSAILRKPLVKLFASVLRKEDDQHYFLVTPAERVPIEVEDAPFLAVAMSIENGGKEQRLSFRTSLDDVVTADPSHPLSFRGEKDGSFTPFVLIRGGLNARIARPVYYELIAVADEAGGVPGVWSEGAYFPFPASPFASEG